MNKQKGQVPKVLLSARVPRGLHAALWREAGRRGVSLSQLINEMLDDAVKRTNVERETSGRA